ncbi:MULTISPECIES: sensor histidine kinase [unclassified Algibacter]|uniref:sensor histidine kinase n=1 Tax=unclassified Algibacter TaxID=2615009 RepID=UPI00131B1FBF|nr:MULTISPECIES: ATP-binding protein [unclassified Algibacter]MCL5130466.1 ATP-binding protein [Algibacter sp. L4_22]
MGREGQAILVAVFTLVFLCLILVALFVVFHRRKNHLLLKQKEIEKQFEQEIAKTQIEIREETFRNISWELHDNIGQLLTLAKIQLQDPKNIEDVKETLNKGLIELRSLSKQINPEALKLMRFTEAITQEIERFNRLNFIKASIEVLGEERLMEEKTEIVLFRILQEFFSNTMKHAKARHLSVMVNFKDKELLIIAKDDGKGFDSEKSNNFSGIGLSNIKNRAKLVNAGVSIFSKPNQGTQLTITITHESI